MGLTEFLTNWVTSVCGISKRVSNDPGDFLLGVLKDQPSFMKHLRDFSFFLIVASSFLSVLIG